LPNRCSCRLHANHTNVRSRSSGQVDSSPPAPNSALSTQHRAPEEELSSLPQRLRGKSPTRPVNPPSDFDWSHRRLANRQERQTKWSTGSSSGPASVQPTLLPLHHTSPQPHQ
jgi:hypothetical protein